MRQKRARGVYALCFKDKTVKRSVRRIARISVFAALIAVCSQICLPFAVPFTMQTFALFLTLFLLKNDAIIAASVYIIIGAVGVPVFSGFTGGIAVLAGATGGYIFGFLLSAVLYALIIRFLGDKPVAVLIGAVAALTVCYLVGAAWYGTVCKTDFLTALALGVFPYILPDALKLFLALTLSKRLLPIIK